MENGKWLVTGAKETCPDQEEGLLITLKTKGRHRCRPFFGAPPSAPIAIGVEPETRNARIGGQPCPDIS